MTATRTFQDKYFALPGDMANATKFWGRNSGCSGSDTVASPGTCNGNGNGNQTDTASGAGAYSEIFLYWQQLVLAGLIEGNYTGTANPTGWTQEITPGTNVPRSKLSNGAWSLTDWANTNGDSVWLPMVFGVSGPARLYLGQTGSVSAQEFANHGPLIKPEEMWNLDTKMDDGKPAIGRLRVVGVSRCTTAASGADAGIASAEYKLNSNAIGCALMFDNNGRGAFAM